MDKKSFLETIATGVLLVTSGATAPTPSFPIVDTPHVQASLTRRELYEHNHTEQEPSLQNLNARSLYLISGRVPVYDKTDCRLVTVTD